MKRVIISLLLVGSLLVAIPAFAAPVDPVVGDYGDVFPGLLDIELGASRTTDSPPYFVRFNLIAPGNVTIGVHGRTSAFGSFGVTSIYIADFDTGDPIAFGSDTFPDNPFDPAPITHLVTADNLSADTYALAVSGTGNVPCCLGHDWVSHLNVTAVPVPAAGWLLATGLVALFTVRRKI